MYLSHTQKKQDEKCFTYDLSQGIASSRSNKMGKMLSAFNYSSGADLSLTSISELIRGNYVSDAISIGTHSGYIYYNTTDSFYFNGVKKGGLTGGKKAFVNFGDRIFIFPDRKYYDISTDTFDNFNRSVTSENLKITSSNNEYVASFSMERYGNLAEYLIGSSSIKITGSENGRFDGCYRVNSIDTENGVVRFGHFEGEISDPFPGLVTISNEVPPLEGACICKNRIIGYAGNKIYASAAFDPMSWCDMDDEREAYVFENIGGDPFTACDCIEDQPVFFTSSSVYKVYGDNAKEYSLRSVSGIGGISPECAQAHAKLLGDIYFLSGNTIVKFSGVSCEVVCRLKEKNYKYCIFFASANKLYFYYIADGNAHFCVMDAFSGALCEIEITGVIGFVNINDIICAVTKTIFIPLEGEEENLPMEFFRDKNIFSKLEFDEIHRDWNKFAPSKLILRGKIMPGGEMNIYCMLGNSGDWIHIYSVTDEGERLREISIPSSLTDSFRLKIEGRGDFTVKGIYLLFS